VSSKRYRYATTPVRRGVKVNVPGSPAIGDLRKLNSSELMPGSSVTEMLRVSDPIIFLPA
jgi:hypothetical protein